MDGDARITMKPSPSAGEPVQDGEHPRLDWLLDNWVRYMRGYEIKFRFSVKTARYFASGSSDFDGMVRTADINDAVKTNAAIEDLPPVERFAISNRKLGTCWRFNREAEEAVYERARLTLSEGLRRRGVT